MIKPGLVEFNRWETDGKAMGERYHTIKRIRRAYEQVQERLYLSDGYSLIHFSLEERFRGVVSPSIIIHNTINIFAMLYEK